MIAGPENPEVDTSYDRTVIIDLLEKLKLTYSDFEIMNDEIDQDNSAVTLRGIRATCVTKIAELLTDQKFGHIATEDIILWYDSLESEPVHFPYAFISIIKKIRELSPDKIGLVPMEFVDFTFRYFVEGTNNDGLADSLGLEMDIKKSLQLRDLADFDSSTKESLEKLGGLIGYDKKYLNDMSMLENSSNKATNIKSRIINGQFKTPEGINAATLYHDNIYLLGSWGSKLDLGTLLRSKTFISERAKLVAKNRHDSLVLEEIGEDIQELESLARGRQKSLDKVLFLKDSEIKAAEIHDMLVLDYIVSSPYAQKYRFYVNKRLLSRLGLIRARKEGITMDYDELLIGHFYPD